MKLIIDLDLEQSFEGFTVTEMVTEIITDEVRTAVRKLAREMIREKMILLQAQVRQACDALEYPKAQDVIDLFTQKFDKDNTR